MNKQKIINKQLRYSRYKLMDSYSIKSRTKCLRSLLQSVSKAGGYVLCFRPHMLEKMSAMELIECIGNNNIRFIFDKENINDNKRN